MNNTIKKNFVENNKILFKEMTNDLTKFLKKYSIEIFKKSVELTAESVNNMIDEGNIIINKKIDKKESDKND